MSKRKKENGKEEKDTLENLETFPVDKKDKKVNDKRYYNFITIIYEDDEDFDNQFSCLKQEGDSIWIRHDKDVYDKDIYDDNLKIKNHAGDLKKPHYHFLIKLKNACSISAFAKRTGLPEYMVEPVKKSLNANLKYLIHFGDDNKYQYSPEEVNSNSDTLKRRFLDLVSKEVSEVDKVISIQDYIDSSELYIDFAILGRYVQRINMWDAFRRNMSYFIKIVDSHNSRISASRKGIKAPEYYDNLEEFDDEH